MSKKSFTEHLQEEIASIREELGCTEAEAYFTLRIIAKGDREKAIDTTKECLGILEAIHETAERGGVQWHYYFNAVEFCYRWGFPVPEWVSNKFDKAVHDYFGDEVATLDKAFGAERPRHYRLGGRKRREKDMDIYARCIQLHEEGVKISAPEYDGGLFEEVAKEYNISASKVRDIYYKFLKMMPGVAIIKPKSLTTRKGGR